MYEFLDKIDFSSDVISLPENAGTKAQAQKLMKRVLKAIQTCLRTGFILSWQKFKCLGFYTIQCKLYEI